MLRGKLGDEKIQVSMIGPGGENMVRFAMKFFKNGVKDDAMPDRYFEPFVSGRLRRVAHDRDNFQRAKEIYYQLAGWDRKT